MKSLFNLKILIIANKELGFMIKNIIKPMGFSNIILTHSGYEALQICTESPPDIIMCNLQLQDIDGLSLIKEIKISDKIPNIPIIAFDTRKKCPYSPQELQEYGIIEYIQYPIDKKIFIDALNETLFVYNSKHSIEYDYTVGKSKFLNKKYNEAKEIFLKIYDKTNKSVRSSCELVNIYEKTNNDNKAQNLIKEISQKDPSNFFGLIYSLKLELLNKDTPAAKLKIEQILSQHKDLFYYIYTAQLCLDYEEYELAKWIYDKASRDGLKNVELDVILAKTEFIKDNIQKALQIITKVEKPTEPNLSLLNLKAICFKKLKEFKKAIECYEEALKISPMNEKILFNLALCYEAMGELSMAIEQLKLCIKINPHFNKAKEKINELQKQKKVS